MVVAFRWECRGWKGAVCGAGALGLICEHGGFEASHMFRWGHPVDRCMCRSETQKRRAGAGAPVALPPLDVLWPPQCRHCPLPLCAPAFWASADQTGCWLHNQLCLSLPFPGLVLCLARLYVCLLQDSHLQHSSRLTSDAFFSGKPCSPPYSTTITSFLKVSPPQLHVSYLYQLHPPASSCPLEHKVLERMNGTLPLYILL